VIASGFKVGGDIEQALETVGVPSYIEEGHRLLSYLVPPDAHVTVLTRQGDPPNFGAPPITVAELAQLVKGEKPVDLFELLDTGVWIRVRVDTACAIDQQYQP